MKKIIFLVLMLLTGSFIISSYEKPSGSETKKSGFLLQIETIDNDLLISPLQNCNFQAFTVKDFNSKTVLIDQNGLCIENKKHKNSKFCFSISMQKDKILLKAIKGCIWQKLEFSCSNEACKQKISQFGMEK